MRSVLPTSSMGYSAKRTRKPHEPSRQHHARAGHGFRSRSLVIPANPTLRHAHVKPDKKQPRRDKDDMKPECAVRFIGEARMRALRMKP